jgi:hypothetical protein
VIGTTFILASNVVIRLPMLWQLEHGMRGLATNTLLGLVTYYPTAIISYCILVAIGHAMFAERAAPVQRGQETVEDAGNVGNAGSAAPARSCAWRGRRRAFESALGTEL